MIVYGSKTSRPISERLFGAKCPNCQAASTLTATVAAKYGYLYWIPTIPMGKVGAIVCDHCQGQFTPAQLGQDALPIYQELYGRVKTPISHFTGIFIVVGIFIFGTVMGARNEAANKKLAADPQVGDVYSVKEGASDYTMYKIAGIRGDSVFIAENRFSVNKKSGLNKVNKPENFIEAGLAFTKTQILEMTASKKIFDIDR